MSVKTERTVLTDEMWERLEPLLPNRTPRRGGQRTDHREVLEAIICRFRTGSRWRDLPAGFPPWQTVWWRFDRWSEDGTSDRVLVELQGFAHPSTRKALRRRRIRTVIPERADQVAHHAARGSRGRRPPAFDPETYQERNLVERAVGRLEQWHGIATRYDRHARNYRAGIIRGAIVLPGSDEPSDTPQSGCSYLSATWGLSQPFGVGRGWMGCGASVQWVGRSRACRYWWRRWMRCQR